jgi:hypothetical protein
MWSFLRLSLLSASLLTTAWAASPVSFRTQELPWAAIGADYRAQIQTEQDGRCPHGDVELSVAAGTLPRGLMIEGDTLRGVPRELGAFHIRLRSSNTCASAERDYLLQVTGRPILRVAPQELVFEYRVGDRPPAGQSLLISGTWPELPYSVSGAPSWVGVQLTSGIIPSAGSGFSGDVATVEILPKDLTPGSYLANLAFYARPGAAPSTIPVRLIVLPAWSANLKPVP